MLYDVTYTTKGLFWNLAFSYLLDCGILVQFQSTDIAYELYNTTVTSPNYPSNYDNNLDCKMLIKVDNILRYRDYIVKVIFNDFLLENSWCTTDVLKVYDGMDGFSSHLGTYCGSTHPEVIYSTGRYLYVEFQTDSHFALKGFSFSFSAVKKGTLFYSWFYISLACERRPISSGDKQQLEIGMHSQANIWFTVNILKPCECLSQTLIWTPKHHRPRCSQRASIRDWFFNPDCYWRHISPPTSLFFSFGGGRGGGAPAFFVWATFRHFQAPFS